MAGRVRETAARPGGKPSGGKTRRIISVLINKDAAGVKYMDGERLYDNQDLCEMLRTSKRSLQRFRSEYGLRYRKISRKSYYKESDVLEFISRNMEEVVQDGEKVLKMKDEAKRKPDKAKRKGGGKRVAVHR